MVPIEGMIPNRVKRLEPTTDSPETTDTTTPLVAPSARTSQRARSPEFAQAHGTRSVVAPRPKPPEPLPTSAPDFTPHRLEDVLDQRY
jgi:hypothetical protein